MEKTDSNFLRLDIWQTMTPIRRRKNVRWNYFLLLCFLFLTISSYFCSSVCCHKRTHTTLKEKIKDLKKIHIWLCCARVLRIVFLLLDVVVVLVPRPLLKTFSCILFCGWRSKLSESFWFYSKLKQLLLLLFKL